MSVQTLISPISPSSVDPLAGRLADEPAPIPADGNPLRVLLIVESSAGGTGRHVLDLAQGLACRGSDVHVIYSIGRVDQVFLDRVDTLKDVRTLALPMKTSPHPMDIGVVLTVKRYMRAFGPFDIIHGHSSKGGAIARLAALGTGIPAFYTLHGLIMMDPLLPRWKWLFYLAIERGLALRTARIIAVSPEEKRAALQLGLGSSRLMLVPNGIGELKLMPRALARRQMGMAENEIVIGFVGRLVEQKAPEVLLQAFAATAMVSPRARLAMVGAGPLETKLRELASRLGVADKIIWLGARDARTVLAGFDLFALASRKEGLPYVILEAMSAGLPIVATSSAGVEILVIPGENGIVVPPDDVSAFAHGLTTLTSDPQRLADCAKSSRERCARFSIDAMVDATFAAYRGAIAYAGTTGRHETAGAACEIS
jgi:glycosyltransferase involved in cell wall biosynthesis